MPSEQRLMDHFYIKIDGANLRTEAMDDLIEVTVDSNLYLPDMCILHLHDEALTWLNEPIFDLGKTLEIAAVPEEGGGSRVLFKGEITALEPDFGEGTKATLLVQSYDRSHRLHRGTHSQTYLQVTDSDLVKRIAQEIGLRAEVDETSEVYEHVLQHNQTYMEFLAERARRIGYEFYVEDKTLYFKQPPQNGHPLELEWGHQLRSFRPRLTLIEQVDEVIVRGWNPGIRQVIVGRASRGAAEPQLDQNQDGASLASAAFNSASRLVVNRTVHSQAEAETVAQAICDELSGSLIEAEGLCYGQPELRAGKFVKLTALGPRFSGVYFVTTATHIYRAGATYMTTFRVYGRRPATFYALLERSAERTNASTPTGPVIGLVTNNKDPKGWGRIKVKFPWLSDEVESNWARLVSPGAGPERGFYYLPEINDEVLVAFEQGDVNRPYILGSLWNGRDAPPQSGEAKVILRTAGGHILTLDDTNGEITLESSSDLTLKSKANLSLEAGGNMALKARQVNINDDALEVR